MQKTLTRSGLDSNMLKLIAIAAMTAAPDMSRTALIICTQVVPFMPPMRT